MLLKIILYYLIISIGLDLILFSPLIVQRIKDKIKENREKKEELKKWYTKW